MEVAERVHLIPVGYENDRIVLPAVRLRADRVVLLRYEDETDHPSYAETVRERLDDEGIDHETVPCNIFDFYDSIGTVAELATRFADHEVYVNLASGSKVTAIGGMIACMATGATPYYVRAKRYAAETDGDVAEGIRDITELPTYPMQSPEPQHVAVMDYLDREDGTRKRDLIDFGKEAGLPFIAERDAANRKSEYRLLDSHVLGPLAENGYVDLEEVGRSTRVSLTESGRNTLRAFRYLIDED
ncbi:HFX_2341 family transcriptional regulator domain-containing protein [Halosimplex amylolyticum]|uniref:HFX_2341 family transcriptional regulator domain-containing protein n=1 Tax=Halosimplex amylolyticum TaxID=3396616 RepID=UPI003F549382